MKQIQTDERQRSQSCFFGSVASFYAGFRTGEGLDRSTMHHFQEEWQFPVCRCFHLDGGGGDGGMMIWVGLFGGTKCMIFQCCTAAGIAVGSVGCHLSMLVGFAHLNSQFAGIMEGMLMTFSIPLPSSPGMLRKPLPRTLRHFSNVSPNPQKPLLPNRGDSLLSSRSPQKPPLLA